MFLLGRILVGLYTQRHTSLWLETKGHCCLPEMGLAVSCLQSTVRSLWILHWRGEWSRVEVGKSELLNAVGKTHSTLRAVHSLLRPALTKAKCSFYLTPIDSVFCSFSGHGNTCHMSFPLQQYPLSTLFIANPWLPSLIAHDMLTCFPGKHWFSWEDLLIN